MKGENKFGDESQGKRVVVGGANCWITKMTAERGEQEEGEAKKKLCERPKERQKENARPNYGPSSQLWGKEWIGSREGRGGGWANGSAAEREKRHTFPFSAINLSKGRSVQGATVKKKFGAAIARRYQSDYRGSRGRVTF